MGPGFPRPPHGQNDKLKEPLPKSVKDVPGYISRLLGVFFKRLFYIVALVWEAKKSLLFLMVFMSVFNGISPVISAYISANLLNKIAEAISLSDRSFEAVVSVILFPLILNFSYMFFVGLINSISNMVTRVASEVVTNHVKVKIMNKAKEIDVASFDIPDFYEKFENASREAGTRPVHVLQATFNIVSQVISAVSFITVLAAVAWFAPLAVIVISLPSAIITFYYRKKNFRYMRWRSKDRRQMNYYSDTLVNKDMVKEMRIFNLSDTFIVNYNKVFRNYFGGIKKLIRNEGAWNIAVSFLSTAVNCALFFYIAYTVTTGSGKIGDYSLYTGALTSIASCVASLVSTTSSIYEGTLFIDNMIVFMNEKRTVVPSVTPPAHVERHIGHTIEFRNVSFHYPGTTRDVIKNISMTINPGETVVLVGLNGAGKTTLIKLLTRLYDPTDGVILLDGKDIKEYDVSELYALYGIIFQDFGKYAVSVTENIEYGQVDKEYDFENIQTAAKQSAADEFIQKLPRKYQTPLMRYFEEDGIELSIGQWQKLSIARAFYSDSDIVILDEPTASLDAIAEQEIFNQFDSLRKDKTTFFVSHRLSSATIADKILVLEDGELKEIGNHKELMEKQGIYYNLFSTQAKRYISEYDTPDTDEEMQPIPPKEHRTF